MAAARSAAPFFVQRTRQKRVLAEAEVDQSPSYTLAARNPALAALHQAVAGCNQSNSDRDAAARKDTAAPAARQLMRHGPQRATEAATSDRATRDRWRL